MGDTTHKTLTSKAYSEEYALEHAIKPDFAMKVLAHDLFGPLNEIQYALTTPKITVKADVAAALRKARNMLEAVRQSDFDRLVKRQSLKIDFEDVLSVLKGTGIQVELQGYHDAELYVDHAKVSRVLKNLLKNASEAGATKIKMKFNIYASGSIEISVSDNGSGIPADLEVKIINPGFTTKETGTGLGLAYSKQVAQAHGGDFTLEADQDLTCFKIAMGDGYTFLIRNGEGRVVGLADELPSIPSTKKIRM